MQDAQFFNHQVLHSIQYTFATAPYLRNYEFFFFTSSLNQIFAFFSLFSDDVLKIKRSHINTTL